MRYYRDGKLQQLFIISYKKLCQTGSHYYVYTRIFFMHFNSFGNFWLAVFFVLVCYPQLLFHFIIV